MGARAVAVRKIAVRGRDDLVESSAAVWSVGQPGVIFTINDSGNGPYLFALDTAGADRGRWRVEGASNRDWEAASPGRCLYGDPPPDVRVARWCLYLGDVGDNSAGRTRRTIYRVMEPAAIGAGETGSVAAARLDYRYADGPHDVEAMYVAPDGTTYLITKRPLRDAARRLRPALVFALPAAAWGRDGARDTALAVAQLTDSLPVVPGSAPERTITDAALSPDARWLAVRTYAQLYVFATDTATGRVRHDVPAAVCDIAGLEDDAGEGVTWYGSTGNLLLTHEGKHASMLVVGCPLPRLR